MGGVFVGCPESLCVRLCRMGIGTCAYAVWRDGSLQPQARVPSVLIHDFQ